MVFNASTVRSQWYLDGTGSAVPGAHLNLGSLWSENGGEGIKIAIADDGVQSSHSYLSAALEELFGVTETATRTDGDPASSSYGHGTAVAGIIASSGGSSAPVGIAPGAELASLRIFGNDSMSLAEAAGHFRDFDIINNSWGYSASFYKATYIGALTYWTPIIRGMEDALANGRGGLGSIIVKSAGNGREDGRTAADDYISNHEGTILVGATDHTGVVAYYSTPGANLLVSAPSSGAGKGVTTTDRTGSSGYSSGSTTNEFGGTSAAAPMVSGVVALMLEANPDLTWREVQDILAVSARHTGSAIGAQPSGNEAHSWTLNGATTWNGGGMHFSNDYGFGLVDAFQAVRLAETWSIGRETNESTTLTATSSAWTVNPVTGVASTSFLIGNAVDIQSVVLTLDVPVGFTAIEGVVLVSPDGTQMLLLESDGAEFVASGNYTWDFLAQGFRGETSTGLWTLEVDFGEEDVAAADLGASLAVTGQADSDNDVYYYTSEFSQFGSGQLTDADGIDTINTAAIEEAVTIDLSGTSLIDGRVLTLSATTVIEQVVTGDGDDTISGNDVANLIWSGRGDDLVSGGGGNDFFFEGLGDDSYNGGEGVDFVFVDSIFDVEVFSISREEGTDSVVLSHDNQVDRLDEVERLAFSDGTQIAFDNEGNAGQIYRLYETAFNRAPDEAGFEAWLEEADNGTDLMEIAQSFVLSEEFSLLYNGFDTVEEKVAAFYVNSLGRAPEAAGLEAWSEAYSQTLLDDGQILIGFSESAEKKLLSREIFDDGFIF